MVTPNIEYDKIPPEVASKMREYAANLHKRHPNMKPMQVMKNVAKKFNLNVINHEEAVNPIAEFSDAQLRRQAAPKKRN